MWIERDLFKSLKNLHLLEALFIRGPRQTGKSSLLEKMAPLAQSHIYLDDIHLQKRAEEDPRLLLEQCNFPILIDEAHLAPSLFFEIKRQIDASRRARMRGENSLSPASFRLTGSNQGLIDSSVKETLAGRVSIFYLLGLSVSELIKHDRHIKISELLFRGGFPELWVQKDINSVQYINDYISTFIEKDIASSSGIEKRREFLNVLRLAAARVGELLNYESFANDSGVSSPTVKSWISLLETNQIVGILNPYYTNLNKRLIKMPKLYFLDAGICARLQGHQEMAPILNTPQAGHLFESLVYSEIIKTKQNFLLDYEVFYWRTKEKEEIDFIIETPQQFTLIEVKLSANSLKPFKTPEALSKLKAKVKKCFVVASGERYKIDDETDCVPIKDLVAYLLL